MYNLCFQHFDYNAAMINFSQLVGGKVFLSVFPDFASGHLGSWENCLSSFSLVIKLDFFWDVEVYGVMTESVTSKNKLSPNHDITLT